MTCRLSDPNEIRDLRIQKVKDIRRSIDYIQNRWIYITRTCAHFRPSDRTVAPLTGFWKWRILEDNWIRAMNRTI